MATRSGKSRRQRPPATTPEARENQLIAAAVDLAERQILDGTATSQVITHFLKLATTREKLEQAKLAQEVELTRARIEGIAAAGRIEELYEKAITAMRQYQGHDEELPDE
jgi:hypothetical protein